jgi:Fur family transcriptional regulator, ferric uptake regulator
MPDITTILEKLEREGYRLTGPRRLVLDEVLSRGGPFTSADLLEAVQRGAPGVGRATVFRTLELLAQIGVVQRIHQDADGGGCNAYLACDPHHHHHLICSGCGAIADFVEDRAIEKLMHDIAGTTGFRVEGHRLELTGVCPSCQRQE